MKIIIDPCGMIEDEETGEIYYSEHTYPAHFHKIVEIILTPGQLQHYVGGNRIVFNISELRKEIMFAYIKREKEKK